jgi:hypothetical protein
MVTDIKHLNKKIDKIIIKKMIQKEKYMFIIYGNHKK